MSRQTLGANVCSRIAIVVVGGVVMREPAHSLLSRWQHGSIGLVRQPAARVPMVRQCRLSAKGAGGTSHNAAWSSLNRAHGGRQVVSGLGSGPLTAPPLPPMNARAGRILARRIACRPC